VAAALRFIVTGDGDTALSRRLENDRIPETGRPLVDPGNAGHDFAEILQAD